MAKKDFSDWEILAYPHSAIPRPKASPFTQADIFADMVNMGRGDASPLSLEGATDSATPWLTADASLFTLGEQIGVEFVRMTPDGRLRFGASSGETSNKKETLSGFIIQGREAALDNKVGTTTLDTADIVDLNWTGTIGTWKTIRPRNPPLRCWAFNSGSALEAQAKTTGDLPANRSFRFDTHLTLNGKHIKKTPPSQRISWGGYLYSIFLQHNMKPEVHKFDTTDNKWKRIRRLEGAAPTRFNGAQCIIRIRRIAGRLCVSIDGAHFHILESRTEDGKSVPTDSAWPAGKVVVHMDGAHSRFNLSSIKYSAPTGELFKGEFRRYISRAAGMAAGEGQLIGHSKGWSKGTTVEIIGEQTGNSISGSVSYLARLIASADGIDTPFISGATLEFIPEWLMQDRTPINIVPAVMVGNSSSAMPDVTATAQATLTVDLQTLHKITPRWKSYISAYCPITIRQRDHFADGTYGPWNWILDGYIASPPPEANGGNEYVTTLLCFDKTFRLKENNARIWTNFTAPMDFLWQKKAAAGLGTKLFGYDCAQEIIDKTMGRESGGTLQVVLPDSHYPLLDGGTDSTGGWMMVAAIAAAAGSGQPPTIAHPHFPPPYGSDGITWITGTFAEQDKCAFFYGNSEGDTTVKPRPVYGRLHNIIFGRTVRLLPDEVYTTADENVFLSRYSLQYRPESNVNEIYVAGSPPPSQLQAFMPALPNTMAYARLPASDPNSAERTWRRTKIQRSDLANLNNPTTDFIPQYLAQSFINDIRGVKLAYATFEIPLGDGSFTWGDRVKGKVLLNACKPIDIGIGDQDEIVENVDHNWTPNSHTTTLRCFPAPNNLA